MVQRKFFEKFKTQRENEYIYDVTTGVVMPDNGILSAALDLIDEGYNDDEIMGKLIGTYEELSIRSTLTYIKRWKSSFGGFFKGKEGYKENLVSNDELQLELSNGTTYLLILNVTEDCNFRCKYCYLSEEYDYTRNRTCKKMTVETAKKAIDLYFNYLKKIKQYIPNKKAGITFYGGEPFMEYEFLRQVISYIREVQPVPIDLNMTTNGYLLNDERIKFVVENDIHLAISFDGTEKNHDRSRVLENNIGTFQQVLKNIRRFTELYPDYTNVGLISVYDVGTNIEENVKFFEENEYLPRLFFINEVSAANTCYYDRFSGEQQMQFDEQYKKLLLEYIENKKYGKEMSNYLEMLFEARLSLSIMRLRHRDRKSAIVPFTNTCVPGMKISVRVDGTFDLCERVNEKFPIGNVETGLNYENMQNIINLYNDSITKECENCTAQRHCPLCFAYTAGNKEFVIPKGFCERWRKQQLDNLAIIYSILEENKTAFDSLHNELEDNYLFKV